MKKTLFTATLLAASLMAASTVQAAPQEVTMWHYFDQKPEQEMLADMVELLGRQGQAAPRALERA